MPMDPEMLSASRIIKELHDKDPRTRKRIVTYVLDRLEVELESQIEKTPIVAHVPGRGIIREPEEREVAQRPDATKSAFEKI